MALTVTVLVVNEEGFQLPSPKISEVMITHAYTGLMLGLRPANERQRLSLTGRKPRISPDIHVSSNKLSMTRVKHKHNWDVNSYSLRHT